MIFIIHFSVYLHLFLSLASGASAHQGRVRSRAVQLDPGTTLREQEINTMGLYTCRAYLGDIGLVKAGDVNQLRQRLLEYVRHRGGGYVVGSSKSKQK